MPRNDQTGDEWTPLDDLGVEEAVREDVPAALGRAVERATVAMQRLNVALDWDRFFDTEMDAVRIRELPEIDPERPSDAA